MNNIKKIIIPLSLISFSGISNASDFKTYIATPLKSHAKKTYTSTSKQTHQRLSYMGKGEINIRLYLKDPYKHKSSTMYTHYANMMLKEDEEIANGKRSKYSNTYYYNRMKFGEDYYNSHQNAYINRTVWTSTLQPTLLRANPRAASVYLKKNSKYEEKLEQYTIDFEEYKNKIHNVDSKNALTTIWDQETTNRISTDDIKNLDINSYDSWKLSSIINKKRGLIQKVQSTEIEAGYKGKLVLSGVINSPKLTNTRVNRADSEIRMEQPFSFAWRPNIFKGGRSLIFTETWDGDTSPKLHDDEYYEPQVNIYYNKYNNIPEDQRMADYTYRMWVGEPLAGERGYVFQDINGDPIHIPKKLNGEALKNAFTVAFQKNSLYGKEVQTRVLGYDVYTEKGTVGAHDYNAIDGKPNLYKEENLDNFTWLLGYDFIDVDYVFGSERTRTSLAIFNKTLTTELREKYTVYPSSNYKNVTETREAKHYAYPISSISVAINRDEPWKPSISF